MIATFSQRRHQGGVLLLYGTVQYQKMMNGGRGGEDKHSIRYSSVALRLVCTVYSFHVCQHVRTYSTQLWQKLTTGYTKNR
jgi:hypothetical protein